jgi:hypothetical protein
MRACNKSPSSITCSDFGRSKRYIYIYIYIYILTKKAIISFILMLDRLKFFQNILKSCSLQVFRRQLQFG